MSEEFLSPFSCAKCGRFLGEFTLEESLLLMADGFSHVLCFDCEGLSEHKVWSFFTIVTEGDVIHMSAQEGERAESFFVGARDGIVMWARMSESARFCLSSSTYLNKFDKRVIPGRVCPMCESGVLMPGPSGEACAECGFLNEWPSTITMPAWVVREKVGGEL